MQFVQQFGACDCHAHVYGPFQRFPLPQQPVFRAAEAPVAQLESVWRRLGLDRAVLIQGSAYGADHSAMLAAVARSPATRRGVALLEADVAEETIETLHVGGVRAVRLNWMHHLFGADTRSNRERLKDAARLLKKVDRVGWHVEVHLTISDADLVDELEVPAGMRVVIDHMARIDMSAREASRDVERLLELVQQDRIWVKLSGADRLAAKCEGLDVALRPMQELLRVAPDRCVWGLDWPHVNLERKYADDELADLLLRATGNEGRLRRILVENPASLYGFGTDDAEPGPTPDRSAVIPERLTGVR